MMILMLLCAKTARTYERGIFQYVDLTAPNVAAGKKEGFPPHSKMVILFLWMGGKVGNCTPRCPQNSHPPSQCSNPSFDDLICAPLLVDDIWAGFGQSWLKSVAFLSSISRHHMK